MPRASGKDIVEIFGYAPDDLTKQARSLWNLQACPFTHGRCIKFDHTRTICYGTCSVGKQDIEVIVCPHRLYENNYATIHRVSEDAFGVSVPFYMYSDYIKNRSSVDTCVVALGHDSGREVRLGRSMSMDWVLALIENATLKEYVGLEVQSMDITGNYRDNWYAYKNLPQTPRVTIPSSVHGINWANVHKRLIPQLIRKGLIYSKSKFVRKGLYFILPDIVYNKFEDQVGKLPLQATASSDTITVFTYALGPVAFHGSQRTLVPVRTLRFLMDDFAKQFIAGPNLPSGVELDNQIKHILNVV